MKVWLRQHHNKLFDSFRYGQVSFSATRAVVICPDSDNLLIDCSREFFDNEVAKGRIVTDEPEDTQ